MIIGGPPLMPPISKIPRKRRKKKREKKKEERSHELRCKDTFPYYLGLGSPFKSVGPSGFYCFPFALINCMGYSFEFYWCYIIGL